MARLAFLLLLLVALAACDAAGPIDEHVGPGSAFFVGPGDSLALCVFQTLPQNVDLGGVAATFHANFIVFPERGQVTGNVFLQPRRNAPYQRVKWDLTAEETICAEGEAVAIRLDAIRQTVQQGGSPLSEEVSLTFELPSGDEGEVPFRLPLSRDGGAVEGMATVRGFSAACAE